MMVSSPAPARGTRGPAGPSDQGLLARLIRGTFNYGLGSFVPQLVGFLLIPIYTAVLTPTDYGVLDLAGYLGAALIIVMRVGVPGAVSRFYYEHAEGPALKDYVTTVNAFLMIGGVGVGLLTMALAPIVAPTVVPGVSPYPQILLVVAASLLAAGSELQRRLIQAREQSSYSAKLSIARAVVEIGCDLLFVLVFRLGATGMLLATAVASTLFFVQALIYLGPELRGKFRAPMLWESLNYAKAVFPSHLIGASTPLLIRAILAHAQSVAVVGTFGVAMRFTSPLRLVFGAFSSAYVPVYFAVRKEASRDNSHRLAKATRTIALGSVFLALGAALVGPPVLRAMTPAGYHAGATVIPILALEFLGQMAYVLMSPELFYAKRPLFVPIVSAVGALSTVSVALLTSSRFGATGQALAMAAGAFVSAGCATIFARRLYAMPHDWWALARPVLVGAAVFTLVHLLPALRPWQELSIAAAAMGLFVLVLWVVRDRALFEMVGGLAQRSAARVR
jgi:O-antigen/teichoic acid export membrane protein